MSGRHAGVVVSVVFIQSPHTSRRQDGLQELTDSAMFLQRVSQVGAGVDDIRITTAMLLAMQDPRLVEVRDDSLCAAFGDADPICNLAQRGLRRFRQADQYMGVIAEECPVCVSHGFNLVIE